MKEIIEDLRQIRDKHAERFHDDLDTIADDPRKKEQDSVRKLVHRKSRRIVKN